MRYEFQPLVRITDYSASFSDRIDQVLWMSSNACEEIAEIGEGIDKLPFAAGN
jgi:hypothetical protein